MTPIILLFAQNGYLITENGEKKEGYLRYQISSENGQHEIEYWETFKDKNPKHYTLTDLKEYAIRKDTFKILKGFYPFRESETGIEMIKVSVELRGKINVYSGSITSWQDGKVIHYTYDGSEIGGAPKSLVGYGKYQNTEQYWILEDEKGMIALSRDKPISDLIFFLKDENFIQSRIAKSKKFKYKKVIDLIEEYNKQ